MLAETKGIEHFSAKRFEFDILKPMSALAVWEIMKLEYKEVATKSLAFETLIGSLMSWNGLQSVIRCLDSGTILHGESFENPGIMECHTLYRSFEKCRAEGLPPPIRIPSEAEARKQAAEEEKKQAEAKKKGSGGKRERRT